ncbi:hypothetical protein EX895_006409 [Sporisorium graminicola]|uniref:Rgp1-domain-containing protein n=1 Tax=Sporisorium graminicola TaxID=280036 RepID=A0A4U7KN95_9BASI|nr:hypothetical protein EX895_006409 [Sporisorium graminicola]TKY84508.1 hypothetical protein EX895_006409 [Sporisorium graminicola]
MTDLTTRHRSSLKVSIRPLQSSFFAGEDFICQITFTNTNPHVAHTQPLLQGEFPSSSSSSAKASPSPQDSYGRPSFDEKPAARRVVSSIPTHSKSRSVDVRALGREQDPAPTGLSGSARTKKLFQHLNGDVLPDRRNLIGKSAPTSSGSHFIHPWSVSSNLANNKAASHRSTQSTSFPSSQRTRNELGLGHPTLPLSTPPKPSASSLRAEPHALSPNLPSRVSSLPGLATKRTPSAPISPNHSHSRKKSIAQVQAEDLTEAFELDSPSAVSPSPSSTPNSWLGAHSDQNASSTFYAMGRNDTMESVFRESMTDWSQSKRRPSISKSPLHSPIYPALDALAPGTEKILWSFAQIAGTIEIDESLIKPSDFENLKRRLAYGDLTGANASPHSIPGTPRTLGGGDFGQTSEAQPSPSGWSSYLRSPFTGRSQQPQQQQHHRRTGSTLQDAQERTLQSRSVPTFSTPPSIVAVDLVLPPGESKTFQFKLRLPVDLPPSYQGKAVRLKYTLTLGTNRSDATAAAARAQTSRLIQIPIRIYNHVGASGFRPFFDLMNPVILTKEEASVTLLGQGEKPLVNPSPRANAQFERFRTRAASKRAPQIGRKDLLDYTKQLLFSQASSDGSPVALVPEIAVSVSSAFTETSSSTCRAAIEALARTSSKVTYDISKDGKVAAVLTLVRSRYRLGETITGVININNHQSLARIARMSATLETFEEVQPSIATLPPGRLQRATKIVHAEHHESVLDKGRASFSLCVPSGASPEFVTSGVKLNWLVRLSFLTVSAVKADNDKNTDEVQGQNKLLPPPHLLPASSDGFSRYHVSVRALGSLAGVIAAPGTALANALAQLGFAAETKLETVECAVPVSVLPNSTTYKVGDAEFYA